ncbi:MAG TPA: alpha-ribazole phosphatase family protein [Thiobacillus sp.]
MLRDGVRGIDLLRHGETVGGSRFRGTTDDALTAAGWAQMWDAVGRVPGRWSRIVASPLRRCAEFAAALGQRRGLPCGFDARFQEMHFGDWEGRSAAELMTTDAAALTRFWNDPLGSGPPGAEPLPRFAARVLCAWHDLQACHPGEDILLVTHGGVMRVLLSHVLQRPIEGLLDFELAHGALRRVLVRTANGPTRYALVGEPS